jgi:8-oxo-dGTP pyrophosphatase MutT (NUDIX family)
MERRGIPIRWLREGEGAEVLERSGREREGNPAGTGESRPTRVVAVAVIEDAEGRLLFLLRAPTLRASPGKWGFCGGGLEPGENPREAMEREIREEIGGEARLELEAQLDPVPGLGQAHLIVHLFKYRWLGGEVLLNAEHTRYAWIAESEFRTLDVIAGVDADLDYFGLWPGR